MWPFKKAAIETVRIAPTVKPVERGTCGGCLYFVKSRGVDGACHRFPPSLAQGGATPPIVQPAHWCGEWESRTDAPRMWDMGA